MRLLNWMKKKHTIWEKWTRKRSRKTYENYDIFPLFWCFIVCLFQLFLFQHSYIMNYCAIINQFNVCEMFNIYFFIFQCFNTAASTPHTTKWKFDFVWQKHSTRLWMSDGRVRLSSMAQSTSQVSAFLTQIDVPYGSFSRAGGNWIQPHGLELAKSWSRWV